MLSEMTLNNLLIDCVTSYCYRKRRGKVDLSMKCSRVWVAHCVYGAAPRGDADGQMKGNRAFVNKTIISFMRDISHQGLTG